ncbi:quinoprotein dehydrogenase-associated SoxYZ-like carrier [Nitrogeniibacter mangrovi]|uniref:Quinoprotein dehydrogenase-associated SoxYZ-like carrier n=1 Tax=Nitrogeniibacter mangrovi TaxID=2016596 RepID=A0A6C1B377_9RHOO|nr:quinoprotein dehydrogenase-associated SoxYZ-like carrier [Nitrogeniibacter mangrovi]QID17439.1 quinoprotein dehydrogenase-associated SoxYZ-like carrier [Nitrogeniibacter mangrovi]
MKRVLLCWLAGWLMFVPPALAGDRSDPADSPAWQQTRVALFSDRPITDGGKHLVLEAPYRAADPAVVPIAIRTDFGDGPGRELRRAWLIIDKNPSPVAASFTFEPGSGVVDMETRVRVEEYTWMRAIAELADGSLYMSTRYVKASGGCSAPAGKDPAKAAANLGRMRLRVLGDEARDGLTGAQLMISHPNESGMAMNQVTRLYPRPHFVRLVKVSYRGKPLLRAEVNFSISENPNFRFHFHTPEGTVREGGGELAAEVVDTDDLRFETSVHFGAG